MKWLGAAMGLTLGACFLSPIPDSRTPADRAHELDGKCRATDPGAAALSPRSVEGVEREILYVAGGPNGREARFRGARITLAPSAGSSHEAVERSLACHQADVTLGRTPPRDDDAYVLPGRWLSIDVDSTGDGFVVHVRADRLDDAQAVFDRAKAFAARRAQSVVASPPPASATAGQPLPLQ